MDTSNLQDALAQGADSANELKDRVATKAGDLAAAARDATEDVAEDDSRGKGGLLLLVAAVAAVAAFLLKRKREQELDEALWEEPRAL